MKRISSIAVVLVVLIVAAALLSSSTIVTVPTGHTGVVTTFGKVESYVLDEGIHFKLPWQKVVKMDNRAQKETVMTQAFSSDIQQVDLVLSINFSVDRETSQNLYRNVGAAYYSTVIQPRLHENVKAVFAQYSAENLMSKRASLSGEIAELLRPEMKKYGIELINISIEDIDFTDVFTDAVEAKQVAEQSKLKAAIEQEQKLLEAQKEAERQVIAAKADADVRKIEADAEAYSRLTRAEAEAEANAKIAASLTEELIRYTQAMRWNGELPEFYGGSEGVLPILNFGDGTARQSDQSQGQSQSE
ncbi:MAG: prohibitin family protein [Eubacteriales bacterium]|jgi:regulator of protease activity HflC (stomatin/prohibitin superfamily)|nr:prohibitin family protein [Clostridiales bacterium]